MIKIALINSTSLSSWVLLVGGRCIGAGRLASYGGHHRHSTRRAWRHRADTAVEDLTTVGGDRRFTAVASALDPQKKDVVAA